MGRSVRDLRISVTDRCNFRCTYCMPKEIFNREYRFLERELLLDFEEIERLAGVFAGLGVRKVPVTGGEPLLRRNLEVLVAELASIPEIDDLTLTTNGSLLARHAERLAGAGLDRVTVSLNSLDDAVFTAMNDVGFPVQQVLEGIEAAAAAGLTQVKVNAVVQRRGQRRWARGDGGPLPPAPVTCSASSNTWTLVTPTDGGFDDVVPADEIRQRINARWPLEPVDPHYPGEVAQRWRYVDGAGEIGIISSVTQPFCGSCTRARLSAEGMLYTCLFATSGTDLRRLLREGSDDEMLAAAIADVWRRRTDRYSEIRSAATVPLPKVEMSYIGG